MESNDKRQAILEAAAKRFSIHGFHETKVEQIAEDAGVAKGTVYLYFKDKNSLLFEVARFNMKRYVERMREAISPYESARDKLHAYARHQVVHLPEMAKFHKVNFEHFHKLHKDDTMMAAFREDQKMVRNEVEAIIQYGIDHREFRAVDVTDAALIVSGSLHAYVNSAVLGLIEEKKDNQAEALIDLLLQGLGA